ncbi:MAG: 3-oxoacyl-ACP reductase FabG [Desulfobacteraceae bacterium]|nr:MAG: 3-oxoacyl-ACP reductase FabG [Desulfobacteraceae bacterium]
MKLEGKAAIVTGGAQGIGKAVCEAFAKEGADVMVADVLGRKAGEVAEEISAQGRKTSSLCLDVSDKSQVEKMVGSAIAAFGKIDILVNAAGVFVRGPIEDVSEKDWDRVIAVNLKGTFLCSQAAGRKMISRKSGSIVNIASIAGHAPQIHLGAYSPSKAGILLLTKIMAVEWARYGVRVNAVSPGPTATPMFMSIYDSEEKLNRRKRAIPLNRFAGPDEIANAAVFLSSKEAGFVTGHSLVVDGGSLDSMYHLMGMLPDSET